MVNEDEGHCEEISANHRLSKTELQEKYTA